MSEDEMRAIAQRVADLRRESGMSYQELADATGLSKSTLQRYETGDIKNIPLSKLKSLASALNVSPAELMGWEDVELSDNDLFRNRMQAEYGALFDLVEKADEKQRKQIETIVRTIVGDDDPDDWGA